MLELICVIAKLKTVINISTRYRNRKQGENFAHFELLLVTSDYV